MVTIHYDNHLHQQTMTTATMAQHILATLSQQRDTLRRMGVRSLALFGSARHGTATTRSDLDFLVDLEPVTFDGYMDVKLLLEDLFERRVDLVLVQDLKPRLRPSVLSEAVYVPGL